jgi:hypothetical protein
VELSNIAKVVTGWGGAEEVVIALAASSWQWVLPWWCGGCGCRRWTGPWWPQGDAQRAPEGRAGLFQARLRPVGPAVGSQGDSRCLLLGPVDALLSENGHGAQNRDGESCCGRHAESLGHVGYIREIADEKGLWGISPAEARPNVARLSLHWQQLPSPGIEAIAVDIGIRDHLTFGLASYLSDRSGFP